MGTTPQRPASRPLRDAPGHEPGMVRRSVLRMAATGLLLVVVYAFVPVAGRSGIAAAALMILGLVVFAGLVVRQVRMIVSAERPKLRAFEALALVVPALILIFSYTYLSLSESIPESFTEPLSRIDAVYFATTVFGTVGFGDITAQTQTARLLVTVQILIGLGAAVGLARLLLGAANIGLSRGARDEPRD